VRWLWLTVLASLAGCAQELGTQELGPVDVEGYGREVHGILEPSCATLDCHGVPGRPLRLYAETGLRAPGVDREALITDQELAANARSLLGVDPDAEPAEHLAITKPLAERAGGEDHVGNAIWLDRDEPAVVCLVAWLEGDVSVAAAECALAREAVALPDP